jgi:plastocyanin
MFKLICAPAIFFLMVVIGFPAAFAEDAITIIPCSSNHNNPRFFDNPSYYVQKGQQIRWHNADDINHRIVISTSDAKAVLSDSGIIKSNGSFPFKFNNIGIYHFSSPVYPWMQGNVSVTDNISSVTMTNTKNNVDVQLTWTPAIPRVGEITHFKIIFINRTPTKINSTQTIYFQLAVQRIGHYISRHFIHPGELNMLPTSLTHQVLLYLKSLLKPFSFNQLNQLNLISKCQ